MSFKSILVTGGVGFIGSHVVNKLYDSYPEAKIIVYDKIDYVSRLNNIRNDILKNSSRFVLIIDDINNKTKFLSVLYDHRVDTILHFAAQTHVDNSFDNEEDFIINNILGTNSVLHCCRQYGDIKRFIHVSTDEVYGEVEEDHKGCVETDVMLPTNPYAATKASAEHIARGYLKSYNMPIIITRCNNVYGPHQYPEKLIPKFIMLMNDNEKLTIHGQGLSYRNFIYADDVARAFDVILKDGVIGEIYNIGTNDEYNVLEIVSILEQKMNKVARLDYVRDRNFNDKRYRLNADKLKELGFEPVIKIEQGLDLTIDWYLKHGAEY